MHIAEQFNLPFKSENTMIKFKIIAEQYPSFLRATKLAESIAVTRTTLPVLNAALLTTKKNSVTIQANNLDEAIVAEFEAEILSPGACGVNARELAKIAALSNAFELEAGEKQVAIKCGGKFKVPLYAAEDFTPLPDMGESKSSPLTGTELARMLSVEYSASDSSPRPQFEGVYVDLASKFGVALDGRRMALSSPTVPKETKGKTIPAKTCKMLLSLAKEYGDKEIDLTFSESAIRLESVRISFYGKLIEGEYPDFRRAMPKTEHAAKINREAILKALDAFSFMEWDARKITLSLSKEGGTISGLGKRTQGEVSFELVKFKGPDLKIGLDPTFLRDAIASMNEKEISLEYTDDLAPIAIKADMYAIIMPMRVS